MDTYSSVWNPRDYRGCTVRFYYSIKNDHKNDHSLLRDLIHQLHPWIAYAILPLFAFANAGLSFATLNKSAFFHPLPLGIIVGLFFGKPIGIFGSSWIAVKTKFAKLPHHVNWRHIYGIALMCGIGFTMSLFIADLAFDDSQLTSLVRFGVFIGSLLSGISGYYILYFKPER